MDSVANVIDALGGPAAVSRFLSEVEPVSRQQVSNWKARGSIPVEYWVEIVQMARSFKIRGLNSDVLARMHSRLDPSQ